MDLLTLNQMHNTALNNHQTNEEEKIYNKIESMWEKAYAEIQKGIAYEKNQDVDKAIKTYEKLVRMKVDSNRPYERLAIIYHKSKNYTMEAKVLLEAIDTFEGYLILFPDRGDLEPKLNKFKERLNKLQKFLK